MCYFGISDLVKELLHRVHIIDIGIRPCMGLKAAQEHVRPQLQSTNFVSKQKSLGTLNFGTILIDQALELLYYGQVMGSDQVRHWELHHS
jgi:hypothetical protein